MSSAHRVSSDGAGITRIPWLDERTAGLLSETVAAVAHACPQLVAAIVFGSVARHDERPLAAASPSDVDLLLIFDVGLHERRIPQTLTRAAYQAIGQALDRYLYPPREVKPVLMASNLADWDAAFIENVARDGLLIWSRGPLPDALARIATRSVARA